ncbi:MAG: hypothetical protein H0V53_00555 [Rubrobacter sp.]|jgi:peptide/nickel transport system substrate-binding protein|nr:hypothetical protein [Rubrobacter sp.]
MAILGWTGDTGDPDNFLNVHFNSATATEEDALNIAYYRNDEVDELLEQGQSSIENDERQEAYFRIQEIIREDTPWVLVAYAEPPLGLQEQVEGFRPNPTGGEPFNTVELTGGGA